MIGLLMALVSTFAFALPQMVVPNEQEVLASYSSDKEVYKVISALHEQGYTAVDTSVVSVSEGTFLISTYLERRGTVKAEAQTLVAVVMYRKGASVVRLVKPDAVRTALLTLANETL